MKRCAATQQVSPNQRCLLFSSADIQVEWETPSDADIMESIEMQVELRLCSLHEGASSSPLRVLLLGFEIVCYAIVLSVITVARMLENANGVPVSVVLLNFELQY